MNFLENVALLEDLDLVENINFVQKTWIDWKAGFGGRHGLVGRPRFFRKMWISWKTLKPLEDKDFSGRRRFSWKIWKTLILQKTCNCWNTGFTGRCGLSGRRGFSGRLRVAGRHRCCWKTWSCWKTLTLVPLETLDIVDTGRPEC